MSDDLQTLIGKVRTQATGNNNRQQPNLTNTLGLDLVPPQARDLEEAVLGAMLLDKEAVATIIDILKPECFYVEGHQAVYQAMLDLFNKSQPIDLLTVTEQLRKNATIDQAGGSMGVSMLTRRVGASAHLEHHAHIIIEKHILRQLIQVSNLISREAFENTTDVFDLLNKAERELFVITERNINRKVRPINNLVHEALQRMEELRHKEDGLSGVPSGFTQLDRITAGWQKSDLIILAARPGMGKTSFVLSMARNVAVDFKRPVAIFSLEMPAVQLVNRLISGETGINLEKLRRGDMQEFEWIQLYQKIDPLTQAPIFIDDTPSINIFELRAKCRRMVMQHKVELIIIDYLQLMSGGQEGRNTNREQEISFISRSLKSIAKELEVPIIALSQLNRAVESRSGEKRPQLSDLRESGSIEQDADMVTFLYRPDYYEMNKDGGGAEQTGLTEVIISKHRNGSTGKVNIQFIAKFARFVDLDENELFVGVDPLLSGDGVVTMQSKGNGNILSTNGGNNLPPLPPDDEVPF
ncbi:MAG: replicative DNA helicase [Sphingobacteriales bacterium]|jgi:replicative DNA helicase|nr:replicative DNA helicase [Sphingobacteriales bacterium]MBP9141006.1 replicative DNA helicase [Chitinophagales bacterium]MDA0198633.1 replicative DNA helicase [Bacteroidota bacterium]MBK6890271.1 replicative DNA helicase [Sphingobacteriales bacterium]MBK7527202.1 replicative DNA helicase [Sphingobacteriales bacterium]